MEKNENVMELVSSHRKFSHGLFHSYPSKKENFAIAPHGYYTVSAMNMFGAQGDTFDQFAKALNCSDPKILIQGLEAIHSLPSEVRSLAGNEMLIKNANAALFNAKMKLVPEYQQFLAKAFQAEAFFANLPNDADTIADKVNSWCARHTGDKIKQIVTAQMLNERLNYMIFNALFFKGIWDEKFPQDDGEYYCDFIDYGSEPEAPKDEWFYLANGELMKKEYMKLENKLHQYAETEKMQVLRLKYDGPGYMMIYLPKKKAEREFFSVEEIEQDLLSFGVVPKTGTRIVHVSMPKYKVVAKTSGKVALNTMGIEDAFNPEKANFRNSVIVPENENHKAYLAGIHQEVQIDVNEIGTSAAAITSSGNMELQCCSSQQVDPTPVIFTMDHPFYYEIHRDLGKNGSIVLFSGQIDRPMHE